MSARRIIDAGSADSSGGPERPRREAMKRTLLPSLQARVQRWGP